MKPFYTTNNTTLWNGDCLEVLKELPSESIDSIVTDPPYQLSSTSRPRADQSASGSYGREVPFSRQQSRIRGFMGKEWDVLPPAEVWRECLRVLKPGAFAFIMTTPRQDSLCQILMDLTNAGFQMSFSSLYWAYSSGFPKAMSISKAVDQRLGAEREVIGRNPDHREVGSLGMYRLGASVPENLTAPATPQAKALEHSFAGFQPKPAIEIILVVMRPLSEKSYVDQALKNRKGITWLGDGRIPYESEEDKEEATPQGKCTSKDVHTGAEPDAGNNEDRIEFERPEQKGRFPADLLVSNDVLNDGRVTKSGKDAVRRQEGMFVEHHLGGVGDPQVYHPDSGSFSRYFDLDAWWTEKIKQLPASVQKTFPFLIVPKASKGEKDKYLETSKAEIDTRTDTAKGSMVEKGLQVGRNIHPTVKPVKLYSYLIILGSREGDTVLDPFMGSGTAGVACQLLGRAFIGVEVGEEYCQIAMDRMKQLALL